MIIETQFKNIHKYEYPYTPERFAGHLTEAMSAHDFKMEELAYDIRTGLLSFVQTSDQCAYSDARLQISIEAMQEKIDFCLLHGLRDVLTIFMLNDNIGMSGTDARNALKDPAICLNKLIKNNGLLDGYQQVVTDTIGYCLMQAFPDKLVRDSLSVDLLEKFVFVTKRAELLDALLPKVRKNFLETDLSL